jgi:rRNA maturation endonuclease Nob1
MYYDDNFGNWEDMNQEENREFYARVQRESVWKKCQGCGRRVKLRPDYGICNMCADKIERGGDF